MSKEPLKISILDARLAEIDSRLRAIQTGLAQDAAREPGARESAGPPAGAPLAGAAPAAAPPPAAPPPGVAEELPPRVEVRDPAAATPPREAAPSMLRAPEEAHPRAPEQPQPGRAPEAAGGEAAELIAELRRLADAHERVLGSMHELLSAYGRALDRVTAAAPTPGLGREVSISVGPLRRIEALRGFERSLAMLPEVRGVEVRGYEGDDRAILDVQLVQATS